MDVKRWVRYCAFAATSVVGLVAFTFAMPVPLWRTGERPLPPLQYRTRVLFSR